MWHLIFSFLAIILILIAIYPFVIKLDVRLNVLRLKGIVSIKFLGKVKLEIKFRIKNGYVYLYFNNKERKEKISQKNINLRFFFILIRQAYFRQQLLNLNLTSNFGYLNDSCVTATASGFIDVLAKCVFSKIKNNKKSAHIFVDVEPKYNEDIFNLRLIYEIRISIFDAVYILIHTLFYFWRDCIKRKKFVGN